MRRLVPLALSLLAACAHSLGPRSSPDFASRIAVIHTAVLLGPDLEVVEMSAGGGVEEKPRWTESARSNTERAVLAAFPRIGIALQPMRDDARATDTEQVRALAGAVFDGVIRFVYKTPFPEKRRRFDYSVGPIGELLDRNGADALVIVRGLGLVPTTGRQIMNALVGGPPEQSGLTLAVVDRTGALLWFNHAFMAGSGSTLVDSGNADRIVQALLSEFPARP